VSRCCIGNAFVETEKGNQMIKNVLIEKNPWTMGPTYGAASMRRIPNAPSKGVMLDASTIRKAIFEGCERVRKQMMNSGIELGTDH